GQHRDIIPYCQTANRIEITYIRQAVVLCWPRRPLASQDRKKERTTCCRRNSRRVPKDGPSCRPERPDTGRTGGDAPAQRRDCPPGELPEGSRIIRRVEPAVERGEMMTDTHESSSRKMVLLAGDDDVFQAHAFRPRIVEYSQALLGPDLTLYQDQLFMKQPGVGPRNRYHQDQPAGFHIDPPDLLVTCWTALDASTEENGCLRYLPGSHMQGAVSKRQ